MIKQNKKEQGFKKTFLENLITITTLLLLVYVIVYQLYLIEIVEIVAWGSEIGIVIYNLSLSIIASGIFYYLVVYIPEKRKKRKVRQVINMRFEQIEMSCMLIYKDITRFSTHQNAPIILPEKLDEFKSICKDMLLTSRPPDFFAGSAIVPLNNWFEYFKYSFRYDDNNLEELYKYSNFLEPDTMQLMHDLSSHTFRKVINQYQSESKTNEYAKQFDSLSHILYGYLETLLKFKQDSWM